MLSTGKIITQSQQVDYFEVTDRGYYRFDIVKTGALFDLNPDEVIYSIIRKRQVYTYGDPTLYDLYNNVKMQADQIQKKQTKDSTWDRGVFVSHIIAENTKFNCRTESTLHNAVLQEQTIQLGDVTITYMVADALYSIKTNPINFDEYHKVTLVNDNIKEVSNSPFYSLETLRRRFDIEHIDENDFVVATDYETAMKRLTEWDTSPEPYRGFDTETTGLDVNLYGDDHMVGIILGESETKSTYFPFRHEECPNLPMDFLPKLMAIVIAKQDICVAHNKKFDRKVMLKEGYDLHVKWDTLWGSMILDPQIKRGIHDLKSLIFNLTHKRYLELEDIFISKKDINFAILTEDLVRVYGCPDGSNVIILLKDQLSKVPKNQMRLWDMENRLADICADMEYYGLRVDTEKYKKQYENCNYILDVLLKAFRVLTHEDGNINSSDVLYNLIYNKMKCPILKRTAKGFPSVSSDIIKMLGAKKRQTPAAVETGITDKFGNEIISAKALSESQYPAMLILAKYKEYFKLKSAFYARFERTMSTGRVFFWINQWGAATGRQSSPMHQLPPELKDCILSDSPQKDFWGPDFSQIELRMIAYLAGEQQLIDMAKDPTKDVHRIIGSLISGLEMWQITPQMRSTGKRRNFGVVYLISAMGLAAQMFGPAYTKENVEFCQQQLDDFYNSFKRIDRYIKRNAQLVQQRGYMETKWFHRRRVFPEIFDPNLEPRRRASILRMANNVPVQGTSADYLKLAEIQMYDWIYARGWNKPGADGFPMVRMMLSIHDELIISADKSIPYEEIITMITKCMETPVKGAPPFSVQPALMENWGEHSNDACAMPIPLRDKLIEDYQKTGKSVINHDNYLQILDQFRKDTLTNYMQDLINKYGPDPINVGNHVRDGALTFDLLDLYHNELKKYKDMEQADLINEATKLYMANNGQTISKPTEPEVKTVVNLYFDNDINALEPLVEFDKDGNPIFDEYDEPDDITDMMTDEDVAEIDLHVDKEPTYVWKTYDTITVDLSDYVDTQKVNDVLAHMMKYRQDNGFYRSCIIYSGRMIDTGIPMENCDTEELSSYVKSLIPQKEFDL